jgi:hypothetical protein
MAPVRKINKKWQKLHALECATNNNWTAGLTAEWCDDASVDDNNLRFLYLAYKFSTETFL